MSAAGSTAGISRVRPVHWPWIAFGVFLAVALVGVALNSLNSESQLEQVPYVIAFTLFGATGALLLSRDPRNVIGALLLFASMATAFSFAGGELLTWLVAHGRTSGPLAVLCGLLNGIGWLYGILLVLFLLPLLFPDGHLPSRRWRPFLWFVVGFIALLSVWLVFGSETLTGSGELGVSNPLYIQTVGNVPSLDPLIGVLYPLLLAISVTSLVLRFRRAEPDERQQIKWAVFGFVIAVVGIIVSGFLEALPTPLVSAIVGGLAFLIFPVSVAVSVLQYRLYDLDVVVKKTLLSGTVVVFMMAIYALVVAAVNAWAGNAEGARVAGAAIAGLCLWPSLALARRVADRLVYGRRASAYEVLTEFSERLGGSYATEDVLERMAATLAEGTGAASSTVWLAVGGRLRASAVWPPGSARPPSIPLGGGAVESLPGDAIAEVSDKGELLGALSVTMPPSDPITPTRAKLITDLATQAGLVLRNVRLVEGMRGLQHRLVAAQDEERRKIERNLHDGVQQQLVALNVQLGLLAKVADREPARVGEMASGLQTRATEALEDLRDLARGIYPPLLADKGLAAALEAQARKAAVPTTVEADGIGRYDRAIEAAVYFCSLEAINNTAKYANASAATVALEHANGHLTFSIADDGIGFDAGTLSYGTGLQGMADRLDAIGGKLAVVSTPGAGTTVTGSVPTGSPS